jgi:hypothetical protein
MPQLMAEANEVYVKEKNEDFMTILSGALGQRRIHIHVGKVLDTEIDAIKADNDSSNKQVVALAQVIDDAILVITSFGQRFYCLRYCTQNRSIRTFVQRK